MKNIIFPLLIASIAIVMSCEESEEDSSTNLPCDITSSTLPEADENPLYTSDLSNGKLTGATQIRIKKTHSLHSFLITSSKGQINYDDNFSPWSTRYTPNDDPNGEIFDDGSFWYIDTSLGASNSTYNYDVTFECNNIESSITSVSITSPSLCEMVNYYDPLFVDRLYSVPVSQNEVTITFNVKHLSEQVALGSHVSEEPVTIKNRTVFAGKDTVHSGAIPYTYSSPVIFPKEVTLDLFRLTGINQTDWPEGYSGSNVVLMYLELTICGENYPAGTIEWFTR